MDTYPDNYPTPLSIESVIAAAIAAIIFIGLLWGLVELSQSRGESAQRLTGAERACAHLSYPKEREACIKQWLRQGDRTAAD